MGVWTGLGSSIGVGGLGLCFCMVFWAGLYGNLIRELWLCGFIYAYSYLCLSTC